RRGRGCARGRRGGPIPHLPHELGGRLPHVAGAEEERRNGDEQAEDNAAASFSSAPFGSELLGDGCHEPSLRTAAPPAHRLVAPTFGYPCRRALSRKEEWDPSFGGWGSDRPVGTVLP